MLESILLTSTRIDTFIGLSPLTNASGFSSSGARAVSGDEQACADQRANGHFPDGSPLNCY